MVSFAWEGIEHLFGQVNVKVGGSRLQLIGDQDEDGRYTGDDDNYWFGRFISDPLFNMTGYILGSEVSKRYWPNLHEFPLQAYRANWV